MLWNPPEWACLGVEEKGSAAFIYTLVRDEQSSEHPHRPGLLLSVLLAMVASAEGFQGISNLPCGGRGPALTLWPWSWPPVLGWAGGILLHQLLVTRVTHLFRLDAWRKKQFICHASITEGSFAVRTFALQDWGRGHKNKLRTERVKYRITQCIIKYSMAAVCQMVLTRHVQKGHEVSY